MKTTTSVKLDSDVKKNAKILAGELGLSLSSVINATLKQFVTERRLTLSVLPKLKKRKEKEFLAMRKDVKEGKNLSGPYTDVDDLFKALEI